MEAVLYYLENALYYIASLVSILIEIVGLAMIVYTLVRAIIKYIKVDNFCIKKMFGDSVINKGLSIALEILLASEIVKTITIASLTNLIVVVVLVLIRLFMAFMLHWEGKHKPCEEEKCCETNITKTTNTKTKAKGKK